MINFSENNVLQLCKSFNIFNLATTIFFVSNHIFYDFNYFQMVNPPSKIAFQIVKPAFQIVKTVFQMVWTAFEIKKN